MREQLQIVDDLLRTGEIKKAEVLLARYLRNPLDTSDQVQILIRRARLRLMSARPEEALSDLQDVQSLSAEVSTTVEFIELFADSCLTCFELASVGFSNRSFINQAREAYETILRDHPQYDNIGWVYYQLGRVWMATDHIEQAVTCFQQSLLSPTHVAELAAYCYERLGFVEFYEARDLKRALGFLNRAIDTYPAGSDRAWLVQVHLRRSRVLRQMENLEAALSAAQSALSLASGSASDDRAALAEAQLAVGELLAGLPGRERETIACLQQFMTNARKPPGIDVTWSRVNEMLGDAYFNLARYEDAVLAYRAALAYNPDHPWEVSLRYRIARSFYQQRDYEQTVTAIQSILDAAKADNETVDDYRIYSMLGGAQLALGHYEQAVQAYKAALESASANEDDLSRIRAYYDQARELLSTIRS